MQILNALMLNAWLLVIVIASLCLPMVNASAPFPDIAFSTFSQSIQDQFGTEIKLATVLTLLLSLTNNTDMLNLHSRQKHPSGEGEIKQTVSGWMKAFIWRLQSHLGAEIDTLFQPSDNLPVLSRDARITRIGHKIDTIVETLQLTPYTTNGQFRGWLGNIPDLTPVRLLCPITAQCCICKRAIRQVVRERDVPVVNLCEGAKIHHDVALLTGSCTKCQVQRIPHVDFGRVLISEQHRYDTLQIMSDTQSLKIQDNFAGHI
jgi:hypothetical protein